METPVQGLKKPSASKGLLLRRDTIRKSGLAVKEILAAEAAAVPRGQSSEPNHRIDQTKSPLCSQVVTAAELDLL